MACSTKRTVILLSLLISLSVFAKGKLESHTGVVENSYNFWLYDPYASSQNDSTEVMEAHPLVIFLHGASLCGKNLDKVKTYGTIDAIEKGRKLDAYVIAPQNPGGSWNPHKVMRIVDWVEKTHNVDSNRVYVLGMSLGGYGTIDLAATYPERIAAAMALCGGGTVRDLSGLNEVPLWIIHGMADRAVSIRESDMVAEAIKRVDKDAPRLKYDRVPGMNHGQPARFLYLEDTYDWLMQHSLDEKERKVHETFNLGDGILRKVYQGLTFKNSSRKTGKARKTGRKTTRKKN